MSTSSPPRSDRFLVYRDLAPRGVHYSRQHIGRLEAQGLFPRRVQITPARVGWLESEVDAWIQARAAARYAPASDAGDGTPTPIAAAPRGR